MEFLLLLAQGALACFLPNSDEDGGKGRVWAGAWGWVWIHKTPSKRISSPPSRLASARPLSTTLFVCVMCHVLVVCDYVKGGVIDMLWCEATLPKNGIEEGRFRHTMRGLFLRLPLAGGGFDLLGVRRTSAPPHTKRNLHWKLCLCFCL